MFPNISTGSDLRRIVVRLCACVLIVGLAGQTLIIGPMPRVSALSEQVSVPVSAPPVPFTVDDSIPTSSAFIFEAATRLASGVSSFLTFVAPHTNDSANEHSGFENATLVPIYRKVDSEKLKVESANAAASINSSDSPDSFNPRSEIPVPHSPMAPPPTGDVTFDFDGDGKADVGRWRGIATEMKVKKSGSSGYSDYTLGSSSAIATPGDFNNDGNTDACVFEPATGTWTYKTSPGASVTTIVSSFGSPGDIPFVGKFDTDTTPDIAVFRPSTSTWWFRYSSSGSVASHQWGTTGDIPITGNWDGDSLTDYAVYRPSNGTWYIQKGSGSQLFLNWGLSYDIPVQGDFDGDGKSDVTVFRPTTGTWYILASGSGFASYSSANWGVWTDQPVPADYDGDGTTDLAVWRPTDGAWYIYGSTSGVQTHTLGTSGDTAVPSAYTKQVGGTATGDVVNAARLSPRNATGGTNLYSQNFGWGTSLVGLPGRAGLDAGFGIGYNSLVWLKVGSAMYFNPDQTNVTPGFRMGFPVIEPIYYDNDKAKWSYMMVTPSGSRIEFRQTTASNVYETADSSYTQLVVNNATNPYDPYENLSITVTTTDGTQMTYSWGINSYKCTQIKDRNGNYITLAYDSIARLSTMTDTLRRVVTVNYGSNDLPSTITQTWKDTNGSGSNVTHTWATFAYTTKTVDTDFATSLSVVGPPDGTVLTVLDKITYADSSSTKFEYNDYLQVKKVSSIAADSTSHVLNYVSTNLASPSSAQTDCPRFTSTGTWVENFNQNSSGTAQEVVVTNDAPTSSTFTAHGGSESTSMVKVGVTGHPDSLFTKVHYAPSGYREGLGVATEDCVSTNCTGTDRKRWTWTSWTQDDTSKSYIVNPRVIESRVGDGTNTKRSTVEYYPVSTGSPVALYGLVKNAFVYDTDLTTVLKQTYSEYNLDTNYTSRRIIGLPSKVELSGRETSGLNLMSKVTFAYDESGYTGTGQSLTSATQHDTTNFGTSFSYRGNQTSTRRWDVTVPTTESSSVQSTVKYNIAGSAISQTSPWDGAATRTVSISYTDSWNDGTSRTTYAYPTTLTDPASNSSTVKYRFDIGANVEATSPAPAGQTYGKTSKRIFDSVGRLERDSIYVNTTEKSYVRYEFPTNGIQSVSYAPIIDMDGDGNIAEDEVYSESWFDGAGRVRKARTEHPGSTGGWTATQTEYDILGRVTRSSVPTEVSVSGTTWTAAGDDATRGWIWNYQYYDWKDRVVRTVPSDSNGSDGKDTLITYEGCGCAGGEVTTVKGPVTTAVDVSGNTQTTKRRTQKVYEDILGRTYKTEIWDLDGGGSAPYSTVKTTFNGRDQATLVREYSGSDSSTTYQDTTMSYDGHGRVYQSHKPEQRDGSTLKYTSYSYNLDDSISSVTDGRGAVTNLTYNSRGLLTNKSWTVPSGSGITDPADVSFAYDNLGNRTQMTDGLGTQTYTYDSLSRLTTEKRDFTDTLPNSPISGGQYELEYTYTLAGQLKSYTDAFGKTISYAQDKIGRLSTVSGTGSVTYASNPQYRAWGALSHLEYGNGTEMNAGGFNNKLQATTFEIKKGTTSIINKSYDFHTDGSLKSETDANNAKFDRLFVNDFADRLSIAKSGAEARGSTDSAGNIPFGNTYGYSAFGHQVSNSMKHYSSGTINLTYSYQNNRFSGSSYWNDGYDNDGNQIKDADNGYKTFKYDAAGKLAGSHFTDFDAQPVEVNEETMSYDGDGMLVKIHTSLQPDGGTTVNTDTYQIRSSVLGGEVVVDVGGDGSRTRTFIRANGTVVATDNGSLYYSHKDPAMHSIRTTDASGNVWGTGGLSDDRDKQELDADGRSLDFTDLYIGGGAPDLGPDMFAQGNSFGLNAGGHNTTYAVNGVSVPGSYIRDKIESGMVGGFFGLMEWQARMSRGTYIGSRYTYRDHAGRTWKGLDRDTAYTFQRETRGEITQHRFWAVSDTSWSFISLFYWQTQQNNRPKLKGGPTKRQQRIFKNAFAEMKERLQSDKCAEALGGREKVDELLKKLEQGTVPISMNWNLDAVREDDLIGSVPGNTSAVAYYREKNGQTTPIKLHLNPFGAMFVENNTLTVGNDYYEFSAETVERYFPLREGSGRLIFENDNLRAAFILLHEFAHLSGAFGPDESADTQAAINEQILSECFDTSFEVSAMGPYDNITRVR